MLISRWAEGLLDRNDPRIIHLAITEQRELLERACVDGIDALRSRTAPIFEGEPGWVQWEDPDDGYTYVEEICEWNVEDADWHPMDGPFVWIYTTHPSKNRGVTLYGLPVLRRRNTITFEVDWQRFNGEPGFR